MRRSALPLCLLSALMWGAVYPDGAAAAERPSLMRARHLVAELIEQARLLEDEALRKGEDERTELLQRAVAVLERALQQEPHHAEARLALGRVLANTELGDDAVRRSVQELYRARQDDLTGAFDCEIAQLLGIALSRLGRFQQAVDEYDRALLRLPGQPGSPLRLRSQRATILGNSAEALMAMGRLDEAIRRYNLAEATEPTEQAALHTLGLAVAYDRDGQMEKSRDALTRSLTTDPAMKLFQSDAVFFVPPGDRNYYVALLAEAFGNREAAMAAWQQFLHDLPQSRYAGRALAHLMELRKTPGLSAQELYRAEVTIGTLMFPPDRQGLLRGAGSHQRSEEEIDRIAQGHGLELRQCYARALRREPRLVGEMDVALVLDRGGAVALAEAMRQSFSGEVGRVERDLQGSQAARDLGRCVVDSVRRWRFPSADVDHDELALPIRFEARK